LHKMCSTLVCVVAANHFYTDQLEIALR